MSIRTKLGPIRFKPKGAYSGSVSYTKYDCVVGADGCLYCAKVATTGNAPPDASKWTLMLDNAALVQAAAVANLAATGADEAAAVANLAATGADEAAAAANLAATAALAAASDPTTEATIARDKDGFGYIIFTKLPTI